jgi:diphthamide synthase (EF-2-diphthine--ammonia ligase)
VAAGVEAMAFGDLYLEDIRAYREQKLEGTGLKPLFPLWGKPTHALAEEMIDAGLVTYVATVDPAKLDASFAGRLFDRRFLADLPDGIDPCGENGEFHTCVAAGPMFDYPLALRPGEIVTRDGFVFADLELDDGSVG